jgi:hypothetical protein
LSFAQRSSWPLNRGRDAADCAEATNQKLQNSNEQQRSNADFAEDEELKWFYDVMVRVWHGFDRLSCAGQTPIFGDGLFGQPAERLATTDDVRKSGGRHSRLLYRPSAPSNQSQPHPRQRIDHDGRPSARLWRR